MRRAIGDEALIIETEIPKRAPYWNIQLNDQLFKLKFQLNMGQTESLKKIRGLRKDIARVKTIARQRHMAATEKP